MIDELMAIPAFVSLARSLKTEPEEAVISRAQSLIAADAPAVHAQLAARWEKHDADDARAVAALRRRVRWVIVGATAFIIAATAVTCTVLLGSAPALYVALGVTQGQEPDPQTVRLLGIAMPIIAGLIGIVAARHSYRFFLSGELSELRERQRHRSQPEADRRDAFLREDVAMLLRSVR